MAQTNVPIGSPTAKKVYSVAVFSETQRKPSLRRNLVGPAPKQSAAEKKLRGQTSEDYPIVRVTDLQNTAGDTVSVDLFNIIKGKPTMGDRKIAGRMMALKTSSLDVRIDQYRGGVDQGGRMTQQRTVHQLRGIAKGNLAGWAARLEDQLCMTHIAGARGFDEAEDWVVPLETDEEFDEIVVNPVQPPTPNRRLLGGDATGASDIDSADKMTLEMIDELRLQLDEMAFPMQPIRLPEDPAVDEQPLYCLILSPRQWHDLQTQTGDNAWRTFLANAYQRANGWSHPLFSGNPGMWNGILVKKMYRPIRFNAGDPVRESDAAGNVSSTNANTKFDRGVLLGAQALAEVYGKDNGSGYYANWHEETSDHGNTVEHSVSFMGGKRKTRFKGSNGEWTDHGVYAVDTAVS
ncbi:N4-gp56 family major capsid protein [Halofilum ochraceum]|uniref:N4-gp56 family major capsid protein n=1 Tax=Halofilum ochraceum TaxID=1611323 RepID=UPI0008DAA7E3|nr:N4-gp56 family major capsid protein [Halofilum ochraceum]